MTDPSERDESRKPQSRHGRPQDQERLGHREVDLVREEMGGATLELYDLGMLAGCGIDRGSAEGFVVLKTLLDLGAGLLNDSMPRWKEPVSAPARAQCESIAHRPNILMQAHFDRGHPLVPAEHLVAGNTIPHMYAYSPWE